MVKNWNLLELRQNSIKYESAAVVEERISGVAIHKLGSYSHCRIKENNSPKKNDDKRKSHGCGLHFKPNNTKCKAINSNLLNCRKVSYFPRSAANGKR